MTTPDALHAAVTRLRCTGTHPTLHPSSTAKVDPCPQCGMTPAGPHIPRVLRGPLADLLEEEARTSRRFGPSLRAIAVARCVLGESAQVPS